MSEYVGRFAPSPTGHLHLGSLLTAVGSFLDARAHNGKWLLRIEDVDTPRMISGAAQSILTTLEAFGLYWDDTETYQSDQFHRYQDILAYLKQQQLAYPCFCSRKKIQQTNIGSLIYQGTCRSTTKPNLNIPHSWRLKVDNETYTFLDRIEGIQSQNVACDTGDFILKRADGLWAYQLAVVVDDQYSGVTHIVRGNDLLSSTGRQIYLQHVLNYSTPLYAHLPILVNNLGQKLSKQTLAPAIDTNNAFESLKSVLHYLSLVPPSQIDCIGDLLKWAVSHWTINAVKKGNILVS